MLFNAHDWNKHFFLIYFVKYDLASFDQTFHAAENWSFESDTTDNAADLLVQPTTEPAMTGQARELFTFDYIFN